MRDARRSAEAMGWDSIVFRSFPVVLASVCVVVLCSCAAPRPALPVVAPDPDVANGTAPVIRRSAPAEEQGPLALTIEEAVLRALENNRALLVERSNVPIRRTFEEQERAAFEPILSAGTSASYEAARTVAAEAAVAGAAAGAVGAGRPDSATRERALGAEVSVSESLPTGTRIEAGLSADKTWGTSRAKEYAARGALTVSQALLRGAGLGPNLASLRQARLDTQISEYELRGFAEALVATVENTYWDYVLARRQVEIFEESVRLAEQQFEETQQRVRVGSLAETELAAAQAEVALRREGLINARSRVAALRVRLVRLVHPGLLLGSEKEVLPRTDPAPAPPESDSLADRLAVALRMRPELNQARLLLRRGDLEIVKTQNGLLPRMDLFVRLGHTGYAASLAGAVAESRREGYDIAAGLSLEYPLTNRSARARHQRAVLSRRQAGDILRNLEDLVREDVEAAHIEVIRAMQQVEATAATRRFQEEKLRAETAKFRVGKSTALLVAAAQRDLVASQVSEVEALTNYLKALVNLHRLEGSLLERRGILAPGREPAVSPAVPDDGAEVHRP